MKDTIVQYLKEQDTVSADSLAARCGVSIVSARQYLSTLFKEGKIERIGKGKYTLKSKQDFIYNPSDEAKRLYDSLKKSLPLADFCVYDGSIISPIQHHLSINNAIYVETNRDVVESVFGRLREGRTDVFRQPDAKFVYDYIDLKNPCIIVKALVSESPLRKIDEIYVPTLEKMLVDTQSDADFDYLRGSESQYMFQQAFDLYAINIQRLMRYARRRNISEGIQSLVNSALQYDQ